MPISGVVITCRPEKTDNVISELQKHPEVELHGNDNAGNIVAVLDTQTSEDMEKLIDTLNKFEPILGIGLTYINVEDEAERMADGEDIPKPFGFRKSLKKTIELD